MMMPFMAGQSMMMGDAFGKSYQYGKRKISAMSNEDFNKLTTRDLANDIQADFNAIIPPLSSAVRQSSEFQSLIIQEMGKIIKSLPAEISQFFTGEESTSNNLSGMLTIILSKMLGLPTQTPQGNLGPGAGFIGAPQTNPFFPGNIFNPNEPITVPPGVSPPDSDFIGPLVPPGGIKPPKKPFIDTRQADWDIQWNNYQKAKLTFTANKVNNFTNTFQPFQTKRRGQSSDLQLKKLIIGRNQILQTMNNIIEQIKKAISNSKRTAQLKTILDKNHITYLNLSKNVVRHIKTFIL